MAGINSGINESQIVNESHQVINENHLVNAESSESSWDNVITLETFNDWINVSSYKIECLDLAIKTYRWRLQNFILLGLLLSTLSGTISVTQFSDYPKSIKLVLNLALTITSFTVALLTGAVKSFKLQETLEEYIHLKQNWVSFSAKISNEIYLPKRLRRNAEELIKENKGIFLDLLKIDVHIPKYMSILAAKHIDKGDDIESQYYKYRDNIIKNEKAMNEGCMKCLSFWYNCCFCFYNDDMSKKIEDNNALAKTIKYSQIENATTYKRKAYQYTLSSIMLNNVKNKYTEAKLESAKMKTNETQFETDDFLNSDNKYTVLTPSPAVPINKDSAVARDFSKLRLSITEKLLDTFMPKSVEPASPIATTAVATAVTTTATVTEDSTVSMVIDLVATADTVESAKEPVKEPIKDSVKEPVKKQASFPKGGEKKSTK